MSDHSTRTLNREFQEKLVGKVAVKAAAALFLPAPLRIARIVWHMIPFLHRGLRCLGHRQIKVEMLDALSIGISVFRRDFDTAGMVMFLLEIGELLEDWTRKKLSLIHIFGEWYRKIVYSWQSSSSPSC